MGSGLQPIDGVFSCSPSWYCFVYIPCSASSCENRERRIRNLVSKKKARGRTLCPLPTHHHNVLDRTELGQSLERRRRERVRGRQPDRSVLELHSRLCRRRPGMTGQPGHNVLRRTFSCRRVLHLRSVLRRGLRPSSRTGPRRLWSSCRVCGSDKRMRVKAGQPSSPDSHRVARSRARSSSI